MKGIVLTSPISHNLYALQPVLRRYAWGSTSVIPTLLGVEPDGSPQAELWFGAHPLGSSRVATHEGSLELASLIEQHPDELLGPDVHRRFGPRLPYLMKVLAIDKPLSLQVHPTSEQAKLGYAREEALGVGRDDPARHYRDESHKPELILAHTRCEALAGFRSPRQLLDLLTHLECEPLEAALAPLRRSPSPDGIKASLNSVLSTPEQRRARFVAAVLAAVVERMSAGLSEELQLHLARVRALAAVYPGDPGVVAALMMRSFVLEPGDALFLGAGVLHAYLSGVAIELQSNSDNVLRGGLTPKPVNVPALLSLVDVAAAADVKSVVVTPGETHFVPPVDDFVLAVHHLHDSGEPGEAPAADVESAGPQILLCMQGSAEVSVGLQRRRLQPGTSVFVPATHRRLSLTGTGTVVRASVNVVRAA